MGSETALQQKYSDAASLRQKHAEDVLTSSARKRIVVAGPGTGKTHLFQRLLENKTNTLTLTFVNSLIDDLALELCGLSEVKTLHSFARSRLYSAKKKEVNLFPKLSLVIAEDTRILLGKDVDFESLFQGMEDDSALIQFYKTRKDYYAFYGYTDIIYAIVRLFQEKPELIPTYQLVVVDEFQDFNKLEVCLIDLLSEKSPIVIAGDDDQALYEFKHASTEHIRQMYSSETDEYAQFTLPFCSRCTRVIVEAIGDVVTAAEASGLLQHRISKPFLYFDDEKKDKESAKNPCIIYGSVHSKQIPWFIEQRLQEIAEWERKHFDVLVISPTNVQSQSIAKALRSKGFQNIHIPERATSEEPSLLDGLLILLTDKKSNLGWRIVARVVLNKKDFETVLRKTEPPDNKPFQELIEQSKRKQINGLLTTLRALRDSKSLKDDKAAELLNALAFDPYQMAISSITERIAARSKHHVGPGVRTISIRLSTIQSSKGLSADYVFLTHFDDQYLLKNKDEVTVCDQDISNFVVALTRARKRVYLISSDSDRVPHFLNWIKKERIDAANR